MEGSEIMRAASGRMADLYREHVPGARRIAYLLTGDLAAADDIAQDAFLKAAGRFTDLRSPDAFGGYLRRTVVNMVHSARRHSLVEGRHAERHLAPADTPFDAPDPAERDAMWRALLRLPERQRAALVLRYYEDLSESDTADILRCRPGTVKSLVSRGLQALREEVQR